MAQAADTPVEPPAKSSKMPLIIGLVLALAGGGGGFYAVFSGLVFGGESTEHEVEESDVETPLAVSFIPMDPLTVSLPGSSSSKHLRFRAELEVSQKYTEEVKTISPRIVDAMNSYLRALETSDIEDPAALTRLRAQLLRRAQVVAGPGRINDLLIMEFVLN